MLPESLVQPLQAHLGKVRALHQRDRKEGFGEVWLPHALARKYPRAALRMGVAVRVPVGKPLGGSAKAASCAGITCTPTRWARAVKRAARRGGHREAA